VSGRQPVRDLWQQRDLGTFSDRFTAQVPAHGAVLVKIGRR
jgi:alpha-galactosidase